MCVIIISILEISQVRPYVGAQGQTAAKRWRPGRTQGIRFRALLLTSSSVVSMRVFRPKPEDCMLRHAQHLVESPSALSRR